MRYNAGLCASPASRSRKICAKIWRKFCKIFGNSARPAQKNCMHSASVRCACCTTSLRVDRSRIASRFEKSQAPGVGITQILRPNRAKELRSFRKISARRAHLSYRVLNGNIGVISEFENRQSRQFCMKIKLFL